MGFPAKGFFLGFSLKGIVISPTIVEETIVLKLSWVAPLISIFLYVVLTLFIEIVIREYKRQLVDKKPIHKLSIRKPVDPNWFAQFVIGTSQKGHIMSKLPSVTIIGSTGLVGNPIALAFLSSLSSSSPELSSLLILSTNISKAEEKLGEAIKKSNKKASVVRLEKIDYGDEEGLKELLKGTDVLVNAMGTSGDWEENKKKLLDAAISAKVPIYIPSEFGTEHPHHSVSDLCDKYSFPIPPIFHSKLHHQQDAAKAGLKVLPIYNGFILELMFSELGGFDLAKAVYSIPGTGEVRGSLTSLQDISRFVVRASLISFTEPNKLDLPKEGGGIAELRIQSVNDPPNSYAETLSSIITPSLIPTFNHTPLETLIEIHRKALPTLPPNRLLSLIPIAFAEGVFNNNGRKLANDILNPGEGVPGGWETVTVESFAKEWVVKNGGLK